MKIYCILIFFFFSFINNLNAQTQAEMTTTAMNDFKKVDKELNIVYNKLLKMLTSEEKKLLVKAQKDWIKFRDSHCEFEILEFGGGSIEPLIKYNCLQDKTEERIEDLNSAINSRNK